jgi:magnesium chelatase family protein
MAEVAAVEGAATPIHLKPGRALMRAAAAQMALLERAYSRVLKLARTIADLAGCEHILVAHLAEALQYRPRTTF